MQRTLRHAAGRRPGFTLIEMLVVLAILVTLFGLTVAFLPRVQERERAARGADRLQGWLLIAKQRALRDRTPTGLRLITDPGNPNWVRDLEYVQQPDDYSGGTFLGFFVEGDDGTQFMTARFSGVDFSGGMTDPTLHPIQPGIIWRCSAAAWFIR